MNEELQKRLTSYLDALEHSARRVGEFAETEVPEAVREWVLWYIFEHSLYMILCLILAGITWKACSMLFTLLPEWKDCEYDEQPFYVVLTIVKYAILALLISLAAWQGIKALKGYVAPRVVIVEQVIGLAKKR